MVNMKAGFVLSPYTRAGLADRGLFEQLVTIAAAVEHSGFDSLWVGDHFYAQQTSDWTEPHLEAYAVLCALAGRTERVGLGTIVSGVTYRNPAQLAKIVTTLDVISKGRAILGIGAAWHEAEHNAYGFAFPTVPERMDRLTESVQICRAMFDTGRTSFNGKYYSASDAFNYPRPVQARVPILVGGSGERRTLRVVAGYADACNISGSLALVRHKLDVLSMHASEAERDPAEITKTAIKMIVVRDTATEAARAATHARERIGMDEEAFADFAIYGEPDHVHEQVAEYLSAGLDGILCTVASPFVLDEVAAAGEILVRAVGAS